MTHRAFSARLVKGSSQSVLREALQALGARRVLDLGCGQGELVGRLTAAGYEAVGIDPRPEAVAEARRRTPAARFEVAAAEALPEDLGLFDAAVFVNALHHVAPERMGAALAGALSALRSGGELLVIEPLAAGSFFRVMQPVEDETEIRALAIEAVEAAISERRAELKDLKRWERETIFASLEEFVASLTAVDPERADSAERNKAKIAQAWRENISPRDGKAVLVQPLICWRLGAAPS